MCTQYLKHGTPGASVASRKGFTINEKTVLYLCCLLNRRLGSNCWSFTKSCVGGLHFLFCVCWIFPALTPEYLNIWITPQKFYFSGKKSSCNLLSNQQQPAENTTTKPNKNESLIQMSDIFWLLRPTVIFV